MTAVVITYFEKLSRDKNIDDCQQTGVKFERTFIKSATNNSPEIKDMLNFFFNFRRILRQVYMGI